MLRLNLTLFLPALFLVLSFTACKKEDDYIPIWYTVKNNSGFDITLKGTKGDADIQLKKGEYKNVPMRYHMAYEVVPATSTTQMFEILVPLPSVAEIYSYDYKIAYLVEGTAEKADVEYMNEKGETVTQRDVRLPAKFQFKTFCNCFGYATATRVGTSGSVKVSLVRRDRIIYSRTSEDFKPAGVLLDWW